MTGRCTWQAPAYPYCPRTTRCVFLPPSICSWPIGMNGGRRMISCTWVRADAVRGFGGGEAGGLAEAPVLLGGGVIAGVVGAGRSGRLHGIMFILLLILLLFWLGRWQGSSVQRCQISKQFQVIEYLNAQSRCYKLKNYWRGMGAFFESLKSNNIAIDKQLLNATGSKLREYFCSYRSICEKFSISIPEYVQIFGPNVKSFSAWDPHQHGYINAMEIFSGLIIFSKMPYEDKIKFLYQFFDLNEQGYLEYDDLAFMFISVCEATCKIYQLPLGILTQEMIQQYLDEFFAEETQLKYQDFIRWSYRTEQIIEFFQIIGHPFQQQTHEHSLDPYTQTQSKRACALAPFHCPKQSKLQIKIDERFLSIIKNDHILLQQAPETPLFNPSMSWIYGIRIDDIRYPLHYRKTEQHKAANEKFLYIVGKNVVVLYPKLNIQRNYTQHGLPVSYVEVSECGGVVASGEMGTNTSIHIWDMKTTKCLHKFAKIHRSSVKMLKFISGGQLLVTVGEPTALVMLNVATKQVILSTNLLQAPLALLQPLPGPHFAIATPSHLVQVSPAAQTGYTLTYHRLGVMAESDKEEPRVTMAAGVRVGDWGGVLIVAGERMGLYDVKTGGCQVLGCVDKQPKGEEKLVDVFGFGGCRVYLLYTRCFRVYQVDDQQKLVLIAEVNQIPKDIYNLQFVQLIEISVESVILVSLMGDVIKVSNFLVTPSIQSEINVSIPKQQQPKPKNTSNQQQSQLDIPSQNSLTSPDSESRLLIQKYHQIFKIQQIAGICFLSKHDTPQQPPHLLLASHSLIYHIDQVEKQLLSLQCLDQNITHIHSYGATYAVATEMKLIMVLREGAVVEKGRCGEAGPGSVLHGFKITGENLIVAVDQYIEVYFKSAGNYLSREPKKIKLEHGMPIHISTTSIPKVLLVITREKTILKLNSESKEKNPVLTAKELNCDFLQTYYPETGTLRAPILFSGTRRIFLVAQPNGQIHFWNSLDHMLARQQSYAVLAGHCSPLAELVFTGTGFISAGGQDGQVVVWGNAEAVVEGADEEEQEEEAKGKEEGRGREESGLKGSCQVYLDEIQVLGKFTCDKLRLKDSQVEVLVKDPEVYKQITKNINAIVMPKNLEFFEPLAQKNRLSSAEQKNSRKTQVPTNLNFKCLYVYGFNSEKSRQTLFYIHFYPQPKNPPVKQAPKISKSQLKKSKELEYATELLLPLNETHVGCRRTFLYFSGRKGLIWSPTLKTQYHYDFHINRITCAAVHPNKKIVATAQISSTYAKIHVWCASSMTLLCMLKTRHIRFITRLQFSRDGSYIVSLGGPSLQQSIQIHSLSREQSICFRYFEDVYLYDIKFNPYNADEIAVGGLRCLWIMGVSNRTLIKKQQARLIDNEEITCMVYTSNLYGNTIESDIITGNSQGSLSLFICGKYVICKKQAHEKSINCLKLCQLFKYRTVVISAGEDNMVKIWDTKFNQISRINVKDIVNSPKNLNDGAKWSIAPQSLDVYHCFAESSTSEDLGKGKLRKMDDEANAETMLLVGTRNGCIIEIKINNEYQGIRMYMAKGQTEESGSDLKMSEQQKSKTNVSEKVQINYINHLGNLPSSFMRSTMFDIRGNFMLTYSRSTQLFSLWNVQKRQLIKIYKLNSYPSVMKFSKTGLICVGYTDGRVQFLELGATSSLSPREQRLYLSEDYQPTQIVFSESDTRLAIIYTKQPQERKPCTVLRDEPPAEAQQVLVVYEKLFTQPFGEKSQFRISAQKRKYKHIYWCEFNITGSRLLVCYTRDDYRTFSNANRRRVMNLFQQQHQVGTAYEYAMFDLARRVERELAGEDFSMLNFSPVVRVKYQHYLDCTLIEEVYNTPKTDQESEHKHQVSTHAYEPGKIPSVRGPAPSNSTSSANPVALVNEPEQQHVPICQMAQFEHYTLMGTINGQVFAVQSQQFYTEDADDNQRRSIKAKCIACFDSPINNMQVVGNRLFVSAVDSSTIIEYELLVQEDLSRRGAEVRLARVDSGRQADEIDASRYYELYSAEKVENWLKYIFPKRKNFYQCKLNCQQKSSQSPKQPQTEFNELTIEPYHILGRNAYHKRNNIHIDLKDNLITFTGCNLLLLSPSQHNHQYQQQFLKLDNSIFSVNPEISTITLSSDKRTLYAGTTEQNCQVIVWDISTRTELEHVCFKGYVSVILLKVSQKGLHAVALMLSQEAKQVIFFISLTSYEILACFCVEPDTQICDIAFVPSNQFKFLACGVNYMMEWTLTGGMLTCERYNMRNPKDFIDMNHQAANKQAIVFYSIIFLNDVTITGGSDGYLYIWMDKNLIKKQNANPKSAILSLFASKNSKIFASGAVDGKAIVWQLGSSSIIQKVFQFNLYTGKQAAVPSKYHIQSVQIGKSEVFIGTRSGQIHKFEFYSSEDLQIEQNYNNKQNHSVILSAYDNDRINSCSFNISSQKLYILTQSGVFSVFNLLTNEKIKEQRIRVDTEDIVKMLACKLSSKIYLILKRSIEVHLYFEDGKYSNKFTKSKQFLKISNSEIKAAILSLNEKYLALLMSPNQLENAKIEIYDITQSDGKQLFTVYKILEHIPANIEIIDFSTDNGYLAYKSSDQDETIIDLTTKQIVNTKLIQFQLQWNQQAKRSSPHIRQICSSYSDDNRIKTVLQIMNHSIVATDQMGSVRLFRYYHKSEDSALDYYKIYLEHLVDVYLCIVSADCNILVTVGGHDRAIVIWRVRGFQLGVQAGDRRKKATLRAPQQQVKEQQ